MWRRTLFVLALALALGACEAPALAVPPVAGTSGVRVLDVRFVPTTEGGTAVGSGSTTYVIATVELTNESAHDFIPDVSRFFLTGRHNERYQGTETGSSALAGVSNAHTTLKAGERRAYTVGFRASDPVVTGTISYEP